MKFYNRSGKIHIYENAGHAVHQECKDFNQRVYEFLRE